jgi:hypothetical protein
MNLRNLKILRLPTFLYILLFAILFSTSLGSEPPQVSSAKSVQELDRNAFTNPTSTPQPLAENATALQTESWEVKKIFPEEELIPGIGYRTTALIVQDGVTIKVYCLDPGMAIPPVGTMCVLKTNGIFNCGEQYQRFREIPFAPAPTPTPTPTSVPFDCTQLGLGLQVTYGNPPSSDTSSIVYIRDKRPWRQFSLDPLAVAPNEIWNDDPISMVYPKKTCGRFTVLGKPGSLPPEVVKIEVTIDCPGLHIDLSTEAADGGYCFDCRDINFAQKHCTVTNKLTIDRDGQSFICQGFYKVIDPLQKMAQQRFAETAFVVSQP